MDHLKLHTLAIDSDTQHPSMLKTNNSSVIANLGLRGMSNWDVVQLSIYQCALTIGVITGLSSHGFVEYFSSTVA